MNDLFDGFGNGSSEDNFDLAALKFFEELDRPAGKAPAPPPPPEAEPVPPARAPLVPDEEVMTDLADTGMDSAILSLMAEPVKKPRTPRPVSTGRLTRPIPRKKAEAAKAPAPAEPSPDAPLSDLAIEAARLFDALPTQDQLLAFTLLEKLSRAAEGTK